MESTFEEIIKEWGNDTEEKRKKVLEKIKTLDGGELTSDVSVTFFLMKLLETFDQLPAHQSNRRRKK